MEVIATPSREVGLSSWPRHRAAGYDSGAAGGCLPERRCRPGLGARALIAMGLEGPADGSGGVFNDGGQSSSADVLDVLPDSPPGVDGLAQACRGVVDVAVADGSGHAMVVAVRVEADLLVTEPEADVVGLVGVRLHA